MRQKFILIILISSFSFISDVNALRKRIKFKKHTQLDFSGETVQGKIRAPEVFYIFQRKKHGRHKVIRTPATLGHHFDDFIKQLKQEIPK